MKILKTIGIILLIIIGIAFILSFIAPTKMESERSITINASEEIVWAQICSLEKQLNWGPWKTQDPNMKVEYSGTDCTVGSHSKWTSDVKEVGSGEQTITEIVPMQSITGDLKFHEPMESEAKSFTRMDKDPAGGIKVTWGFGSEMPRPFNAIMLFMNFEESMQEMFKSGLDNLKSICEKEVADEDAKMKEMEIMQMESDSMEVSI